jgi:hypothetical protein
VILDLVVVRLSGEWILILYDHLSKMGELQVYPNSGTLSFCSGGWGWYNASKWTVLATSFGLSEANTRPM